ncbi:MAG: hypothetical protein F6K28_26680 [Microcoleus sp. SIO2G3]|nr:hypothetical protein [Microcoleus sp. SIO2G3]
MSLPNHHPAYLRYLKARLKPFKRPAFWASASGLLLVLLFTWQYWKNPGSFSILGGASVTGSNTPDVQPTLPAEELAAITTDIDNSSVFLEEFNRTNALPLTTASNQKPQTSSTEGLFAPTLPQPEVTDSNPASNSQTFSLNPQQTVNTTTPFAQSAQGLLNPSSVSESVLFKNRNPTNQQFSSSTTGTIADSPLGFNTSPATASVSPLQSALDRVAVTNALRATNGSQTSSNIQRQASPTVTYQAPTTYPATTVPGTTGYSVAPTTLPNSFTYLVPPQPTTSVPGAIPTTPVVPTTTGNYGQYSSQPPSQVNGVTNPGFNSTLTNPGSQSSQLNQPTFTTPNPIPGQYIGGGQINTFSNPQ